MIRDRKCFLNAVLKPSISLSDAEELATIVQVPKERAAEFGEALSRALLFMNAKKKFKPLVQTGTRIDAETLKWLTDLSSKLAILLDILDPDRISPQRLRWLAIALARSKAAEADLLEPAVKFNKALRLFILEQKDRGIAGRAPIREVQLRNRYLKRLQGIVIEFGGEPTVSTLGGEWRGTLKNLVQELRRKQFLQTKILDNLSYDKVRDALSDREPPVRGKSDEKDAN